MPQDLQHQPGRIPERFSSGIGRIVLDRGHLMSLTLDQLTASGGDDVAIPVDLLAVGQFRDESFWHTRDDDRRNHSHLRRIYFTLLR